jgi:hypothetical protein
MGRVVEGVKQEKLGASSVISMLIGKGVKAEEIKWSGIEQFLEGKKSVTKAELQEFIAGSQLQIEEQTRDKKTDRNIKVKKLPNKARGLYVDGQLVETFTENKNGFYVPESNPDVEYGSEDLIIEGYANKFKQQYKWDKYKLKGGKNYREILFRVPNSNYSNSSMQTHWGEGAKGVLAHARIQDFKVDGKKMLFVEEIQSDWHNEGHKKGYLPKGKEINKSYHRLKMELDNVLPQAYNTDAFTDIKSRLNSNGLSDADAKEILKRVIKSKKEWNYDTLVAYADGLNEKEIAFINSAVEKYSQIQENLEYAQKTTVSDAPFKDNYHEFVLKSLIRKAAEQGYDSIGWTTADIQSK